MLKYKFLWVLLIFSLCSAFAFYIPFQYKSPETPEILAESKPSAQQPYVSCVLSGQLGNQLFEISAALAHAWDHGAQPLFPELNRTDVNIPINRERVFFRLDASALPRPVLHKFIFEAPFAKIDIPYHPDQLLSGYFQSWEYFDHHRQKISEIFAPSEQELSQLKLKHANLLDHPNTVGVHIRTFNNHWDKYIPFVGVDYYKRAMDLFPEGTLFVIFSDRIKWCQHHFKDFNKAMSFVEDQDHIADFYLMSLLKHNIIGNSSYSWWAAYLNQNPRKIVVAPDHFVRPSVVENWRGEPHKNLPGWVVLKINLDLPYPKDIRKFDRISKSIDTQ